MSRIAKALEVLLYSPEEIANKRIKYLKDRKGLRFIKRIELDLGKARDKKEYTVTGDVILAEKIDGEVDVYFNEEDSLDFVELDVTRKMYMDFWRIFITNTVQEGKVCNILIGKQGIFDGVADVARESTQNIVRTAIEAVQTGTDKIISDGATEAKQDTIKSAVDEVRDKSGTSVSASENIRVASSTQVEFNNTSYQKKKEIQVLITGVFRMHFGLKLTSGFGSKTPYGRIYKNGVAYGTQRIGDIGGSYLTWDEDLSFIAGDLVQLYCYVISGGIAYCNNFWAKGDFGVNYGTVNI